MKKLKGLFFVPLCALTLAVPAQAQSWTYPAHSAKGSVSPDAEDIKEVVVTDLGFVSASPVANRMDVPGFGLGDLIGAADGLVALGQKVWGIIQASQAVVRVDLGTPTSVLPSTSQDPQQAFERMDNWSDPMARRYHVEFKNWRGAVAVSFDYLASFQYGGKLDNVGSYLTGILVSAQDVYVGMLWELEAHTSFLTISNTGTHSDPVAGSQFEVSWKVKRKATGAEYDGSQILFVKGNGDIKVVDDKTPTPPKDGISTFN